MAGSAAAVIPARGLNARAELKCSEEAEEALFLAGPRLKAAHQARKPLVGAKGRQVWVRAQLLEIGIACRIGEDRGRRAAGRG